MSEKIGRFEIVGKLGRGAFGMVYKGRDPVINRLAAIKVMSEATVGDPELVARFKREAEAAGGLNHRNIVTIYDLGEHNGLPYIAMEFLEGKDLERVVKDRTELAMDKKVDILIQCADGLHYAHSRGIVHRDVKPANIRLLDDGTVKIMDFGIAKMTSHDMTRTGQFMGTVNYMSPEQIKAKKVDGRSDLFALGVMFYEFVSYRRPFPGDSITAVIYKIVNENPPPLTELHGTPFEWLEGIIFKCLEKDAAKRFETCLEMAEALRSRQRVAISAPESTVDQTINIARRKADEGDLDAALARIDEILEQDPENVTAIKSRKSIVARKALEGAQTLISGGRFEQARDELLKVRSQIGEVEELERNLAGLEGKIKAGKAEEMLASAERSLQEGRFEAAIEMLTKAGDLDTYNEKVKTTLLRAQDEKRRADIEDLLGDAKALAERGQYEAAKAGTTKALALDPQSRSARALLQQIERELEVGKRKGQLDELLMQGKTALKTAQSDRAISAFEKALGLDPKNAEVQQLLAEAKNDKIKADEKRAVLEFVNQGKALLKTRKFAEAQVIFERAVKLDPTWDDAKRGVAAAKKRLVSIEGDERKVPLAVLIGGAVLLLGLGIGAYLLMRPSEALKALRAGDQALASQDYAAARERYVAAAEKLDGKVAEHGQAKDKFAGLYEPLVQKEELLQAKDVLEQVVKWKGADATSRGRYLELAQGLAERGLKSGDLTLLRGAAGSYAEYFKGGYDRSVSADYDNLKVYTKFGESLLAEAERGKAEPKARLEMYTLAQEIFNACEVMDGSLGCYARVDVARVGRGSLDKLTGRITEFTSQATELLKTSSEAEKAKDYNKALGLYEQLLGLVRQYDDVKEATDLARYNEMAETGKQNTNRRLTELAANASQEEKIRQFRSTAEQRETSGDLSGSKTSYEDLLAADPANAVAMQKIAELTQRIQQLAGLKQEVKAAIEGKNVPLADERLKQALAIAKSDPDLIGFEAALGRLRSAAEESTKLEGLFGEAKALLDDGKLDEAEARYKKIASDTSDPGVLKRANDAISDIRLKKVEAQIEPIKQAATAAEAKSDLPGAVAKWNEILKINARYPTARENVDRLNRVINKAKIDATEIELNRAFAARLKDPAALDKARRVMQDLDASNPTLAKVEGELKKEQDQDAAKVKAQNDEAARLKAQAEEAARLKEQGDEAARVKAQADETARKAQADEAARLKAQADEAARLKAQQEEASRNSGVNALAGQGKWAEAAAAIEGGAQADEKLTARVFFNASYQAACGGACNFEVAKKWATQAGQHDDPGAGVRSNKRWANTFNVFKACDSQLQILCRQFSLK